MARKEYWIGGVKEAAIDIILTEIVDGKSIRKILGNERDKDKLPNSDTFYKWLREDDNKELTERYVRACEIRAEVMFEDVLDIADATADDIIIDGDGNEVINHHVIQRDRLRVDARKWMLGKLQPKKYGDKLDVEIKKNPEFIVFDARKKESK